MYHINYIYIYIEIEIPSSTTFFLKNRARAQKCYMTVRKKKDQLNSVAILIYKFQSCTLLLFCKRTG